MSDISGLNLPLDVKAKLAELDLELSEGQLKIEHNETPEAVTTVVSYAEGRCPDPLTADVTNHRARRTRCFGPK